MTAINPELSFTLDDAVEQVLLNLTGQTLQYNPQFDRYRAITKMINRALRANALENEWSYYHSVETIGFAIEGVSEYWFDASLRPRIVGDDSVRLVKDGEIIKWAYVLPRDALSKYQHRNGLWCSYVRNTLIFNRFLWEGEAGWEIQVPVMREPVVFQLPVNPTDPVDPEVRQSPVDFAYPDLIVARACYYYAQTDPIMQPRVQTLEGDYKDLMYQLIERDTSRTDEPYMNEFFVPIVNGIGGVDWTLHGHPHADERRI